MTKFIRRNMKPTNSQHVPSQLPLFHTNTNSMMIIFIYRETGETLRWRHCFRFLKRKRCTKAAAIASQCYSRWLLVFSYLILKWFLQYHQHRASLWLAAFTESTYHLCRSNWFNLFISSILLSTSSHIYCLHKFFLFLLRNIFHFNEAFNILSHCQCDFLNLNQINLCIWLWIFYRRIMWRFLFMEADVWVSVPLGAEFIHSKRWSEVRLTSSHRKLNLFTGPTAIWAQWPDSSSWLTCWLLKCFMLTDSVSSPTKSGTKSSPVSLQILWCGNFSMHTQTPTFTENVLTA